MANINVKDDSNYESITMNIKQLNQSEIKIGVFGEDDSFQVMKATVHEFGVKIPVTPKMRAWFAYQGYPLSPSTTEIHIPERSFLRATFDDKSQEIQKAGREEIEKVIAGGASGKLAARRYGLKLSALVQEKMTEVKDPPLSDMTKERRRGSGAEANPLVDQGRMRQGITYKVE